MSWGGVRPICQLIESDKSLHVRIQIQVIEHTPGRAKMQIHQLKHLLVEDKCKFFQKIFEEQNYSDNSIRAAADFTVFPTLSLLNGGLVGPWGSKRYVCALWEGQLVIPAMLSNYFWVCSSQQCHFWNWEHSRVRFRLCWDIVTVLTKQLPTHGTTSILQSKKLDLVWLWKWARGAVNFYDISRSDICAKAFELYFTTGRYRCCWWWK